MFLNASQADGLKCTDLFVKKLKVEGAQIQIHMFRVGGAGERKHLETATKIEYHLSGLGLGTQTYFLKVGMPENFRVGSEEGEALVNNPVL